MMTIGRRVGRAVLAALLPIACATLPILAHASPPDPSWIAGIYDDDYDGVVILVESGTGSAAHWASAEVPPLLRRLERLAPAPENAAATSCPSAVHSRAPPAS